jgi:hypothetical protein
MSLKNNPAIVFKPADKNLGLVVLDATDYKRMCDTHLSDTDTYCRTTDYNPKQLYSELNCILVTHKLRYTHSHSSHSSSRPTHTPSKLYKSLFQLHEHPSLRVAPFYCVPKMHKKGGQMPPPGRPIVSSLSTPTYHTSVYLDRVFQAAVLPRLDTVCTSSRHFIRDVHNLRVPTGNIILCADVASLYPSIPIDFGLAAIRNTCECLTCFPPHVLNALLDLLSWVLHNNFCTFNGTVYHQIKGTAMGTPVAVSYANIVLYDMEHPILTRAPTTLYRRYIDDICCITPLANAQLFVTTFNDLCPSIQLEAVTMSPEGIFLDLSCCLVPHNELHDAVSHKLYQKPSNKYQYIPPLSQHNPSIFPALVLSELKRYLLACTHRDDFYDLLPLFHQRLTRRGYPPHFLTRALESLPSRAQLLEPLLHPPQRAESAATPPIIILDLPRSLFPRPHWRSIFFIPPDVTASPEYRNAYGSRNVVVGERNPPNIARYLTRSLYEQPVAPN